MSTKIKHARGPEANAPTLLEGELYFCTDTKKWMVGTVGGNEFLPYAELGVTNTAIQNVINAPLKALTWSAYYMLPDLFFTTGAVTPSDFTRMISNVTGMTYRARHYTCDFIFTYNNSSSSRNVTFFNPSTGDEIHVFTLTDGQHVFHIESIDFNTDSGTADNYELRLSLDDGPQFSMSCTQQEPFESSIFYSDIDFRLECSEMKLTNLVLLEC